jgi:uncharacterized protein
MILQKTKKLERQIDEYLDIVNGGAFFFKQGVKYYLEDQVDQFQDRMKQLDEMEGRADALRRDIEGKLYIQTLIPEYRGDVLGLLESTDKVLNMMAETIAQFEDEIPEIIPELKQLYLDLTDASTGAVESMVLAIRLYFRNVDQVRDQINKVILFERESDKISAKIKRTIFRFEGLDLSKKIHMRYFAYHIESIADEAEDVCDRLSIATIKRYL